MWADRFPFNGHVKGSTVVVDSGRFTLIVTSNYWIEQCFSDVTVEQGIKTRFTEILMTPENREEVLGQRINKSILRVPRTYRQNRDSGSGGGVPRRG
jgi:hypothetical protein